VQIRLKRCQCLAAASFGRGNGQDLPGPGAPQVKGDAQLALAIRRTTSVQLLKEVEVELPAMSITGLIMRTEGRSR